MDINKIIKYFENITNNLKVISIYKKNEVLIVEVENNKIFTEFPYYRIYQDGRITNVPIMQNPKWFNSIVNDNNVIYVRKEDQK